MKPTDYAQRAKAAHAMAEAASDPRDKAAFRGAAKTWETLARTSAESAFSFEPLLRDLAALKADCNKPIEPEPQAPRSASAPMVERTPVVTPVKTYATIEF